VTRSAMIAAAGIWLLLAIAAPAQEDDTEVYRGDPVPPEVDSLYVKGLAYLAKTQNKNGTWNAQYGSEPALVGLAILAMLAHGDDPNTGPYSENIKRGLDYILGKANQENGYIGGSMYNHGFATLALAECYGHVTDDRLGPALRKATDLILSSQKRNGVGAWRYSPESRDADTTVSGAQMVALIAARNAGMAVPDRAIERGLEFYRSCLCGDGGFGYVGASGAGRPTTAIGATVFALARLKQSVEFRSAMRYLRGTARSGQMDTFYCLYYAAQAYFHESPEGWDAWNAGNIRALSEIQASDGSWQGDEGPAFCTATALLSLALNFRYLPIYER